MKTYDKFLKDKLYETYDELDSQTENKYKYFFIRVRDFIKKNILTFTEKK